MSDYEARQLWGWYQGGGFDAVAAWLDQRDVRAFNPGATPPLTDAKISMIDLGMSGGELYLADMVRERRGLFARGVIGSPWSDVIAELSKVCQGPTREMVFVALRESGWKDFGRVQSREFSTPKHAWVAPEYAKRPKSEIRNMLEAPYTLTIVK
jgi:hypothetical protein